MIIDTNPMVDDTEVAHRGNELVADSLHLIWTLIAVLAKVAIGQIGPVRLHGDQLQRKG